MPLLDEFGHLANPDDVAWVRRVDSGLQDWRPSLDFGLENMIIRHADVIGPDERDRLQSPFTPPGGIYGAGLLRVGPDQLFVPALFVIPEFLGAEPTTLTVVADAVATPPVDLLRWLHMNWPENAVVASLPLPTELGDRVHGDEYGTAGLPVRLADGSPGILTAGHVAKTVGQGITVDKRLIGHVVYSNYRALHPYPDACADVAVIRLTEDPAPELESLGVKGIADASELSVVRALNSSKTNPQGGVVRSVHGTFALDEFGKWLDVALVDQAISVPGDSGSAVVNEQNMAIGQVVGGHPGGYSLVQSVELLLRDAQVTLRLD